VRGLAPLAWRAIRARPVRAALTIAGVALGVGVLFAAQATNAGIDRAIDQTVADAVGRADLRVSAFLEGGLSVDAVEQVATAPGVVVAAPAIERRTFLGPSPLHPGSTGGAAPGPVTVLGIDPVADARIRDLGLVSGTPLGDPAEAVALITERLAADDGYRLGDRIAIQGPGAPASLRVVGIIAGSGPLAGSDGRTIVVPIATARSTFDMPGASRVDLLLEPGIGAATMTARLEARLTTEPYVVSSPGDLAAALRASTGDVQATTALIAAIALFVGAFLIFNTLSMTVGERAREVGLLRAAGATRGQVLRFVLVGAAILGVAGSLLGIVVGVGLARAMAIYVGSLRGFPAEPLGPDAWTAVLALAIGIVVTLAAALEPATRAARIPPVEALRARLDLAPARRARLRWLIVVFAAIAAIGLVTWPGGPGSVGTVRALAVYGVLLLVVLASPALLPVLARVGGIPFLLLARLEERLGRGSLVRERSRAALTLGALAVGLAMVVALGWTAQAARDAATAWLRDVIPGDEVVTAIRPIAPDEGVAEALAGVSGVRRVTPIATFAIAVRGERVDAAAVAGADLLADGRLRFTAGERAAALAAIDAGPGAIVPAAVADRLGIGVGGRLDVAIGAGEVVALQVEGIVERSIPGRGGEAILVGWETAGRLGVGGADFFAVRFLDGQAAAARPALAATSATLALEANPLDRVEGAVSSALARIFGLFDAIALVAVLMAALGIVNTLTMGVVDRVRELGILRAIGMSRRQVVRMVVVEAGILGVVGSILGCVAGLATGLVMVALAGGAVDPAPTLPWGPLGLAFALGVAVSVAAAWYPSRVASRISIPRAATFE
jgi:putative ABC transport system permease protein